MLSLLTFKKMAAPNGLPGFRVLIGSNPLGTVFNPGPSTTSIMSWYGVTPDGTRYEATSRPKLAEKLLKHSSAARAAGVPV